MMHDFSIKTHNDGSLEVQDAPPIGALSMFSTELLASIEVGRGVGVDDNGLLVILGLVFKPVRFDSGNIQFGQPQWLVCERVA
jgi:hypothetical protein